MSIAKLVAAREMLVITQRKADAAEQRIKRLEGAVQAMAVAIRPLASQGEDYIWRPVERALGIANEAILDCWPASADTRPKDEDALAASLASGAVPAEQADAQTSSSPPPPESNP